jgi:hypothetical protein
MMPPAPQPHERPARGAESDRANGTAPAEPQRPLPPKILRFAELKESDFAKPSRDDD